MAEKGGVQSVERIFQLIEHLAAHPPGSACRRWQGRPGLPKAPFTGCWPVWSGWAMWYRTRRTAITA